MKTIAVYGSLKKSRYNHPILKDSKFVADSTVKGTLYLVSTYPALIEDGDDEYDAEVYEVSDEVYSYISSMELGAGYKEVKCECYIGDSEYVEAIVYYADKSLTNYCVCNKQRISSY